MNSNNSSYNNKDTKSRPADISAEKAMSGFRKSYLVMSKTHVNSWIAFLIIGIVAGVSIGIISVANKSIQLVTAEAGKPAVAQCNDHIDNDGDGFCDFASRKTFCSDGSTVGDSDCTSKRDPSEASSVESPVTYTILTEDGGHLDWSDENKLVAFDRLGKDGYFDLWTMNISGKNQKCLTCDHPDLPNRHIGGPEWHPSGEFLVMQVQKGIAPKTPVYDNPGVPGGGVLNDLWIITADGKKVWNIYSVPDRIYINVPGTLHPHFSNDGTKLFWAERIGSNERNDVFGEWRLKTADFSYDLGSGPTLSNIRTYNPTGLHQSSFFESHSFSPDDKYILFTGTHNGPLEIYEMEYATGKVVQRLTKHIGWDEHAHYSPNGEKIVWISSKDVKLTVEPFDIETEFWLMNKDGSNKERLTYFHEKGHPQYMNKDFVVPADSVWVDNNRLLGMIITGRPETDKRGTAMIVLLDLSQQ